MQRLGVVVLVALAALSGIGAAPVAASSPAGPTGYDVSVPQCGTMLPTDAAFAVVGVNNGYANQRNPCLADQLAWARLADGQPGQPAVALYVNTANPGRAASWWPTANRSKRGLTVTNPYGRCRGREGAACAYVYGWSMAWEDANSYGVFQPSAYRWWLDVETSTTWSTDRRANTASLEGMTASFEGLGASVGLYSTKTQWARIAGATSRRSSLAGLPSWLGGSVTRGSAVKRCAEHGLTPRSRVALTQYVPDAHQDRDVACGRFTAAPTPRLSGGATAGRALHVQLGRWSPAARLSFQWLRDGHAVAGAHGSTFTPRRRDLGTRIAVRVTARRSQTTTVVRTSGPSRVRRALAPQAAVVTGSPAVGALLTARDRSWGPEVQLAHHWLRDGSPIGGATSASYTPTPADVGSLVGVVSTGRRSGYTTESRRSATVVVPRPTTTTSPVRATGRSAAR